MYHFAKDGEKLPLSNFVEKEKKSAEFWENSTILFRDNCTLSPPLDQR